MRARSATRRCPTCNVAAGLLSEGDQAPLETRAQLLAQLPMLLYMAMVHVIAGFDYENEKNSDLARGVRFLAEATQRLARVDAGAARTRDEVMEVLQRHSEA